MDYKFEPSMIRPFNLTQVLNERMRVAGELVISGLVNTPYFVKECMSSPHLNSQEAIGLFRISEAYFDEVGSLKGREVVDIDVNVRGKIRESCVREDLSARPALDLALRKIELQSERDREYITRFEQAYSGPNAPQKVAIA